MTAKLYDLPEIYDIAFSWDNSDEIAFFRSVFEGEVPFPVRHVREPACGSGRFLVTLPSSGYRVTGYDSNPYMVEYAQRAIRSSGHSKRAEAVEADMVSARFGQKFDAAFNSINSIRYLISDADLVSHLDVTASALRDGGVYIVHLNFAQDGDIPGGGPWTMEREGTRLETSWEILEEDGETGLSHEMATFTVEAEGRIERFEERHTLRLWLFEDFKALVEQSGRFTIARAYSEDFVELKEGVRLSGELGNVYLVLRKGSHG